MLGIVVLISPPLISAKNFKPYETRDKGRGVVFEAQAGVLVELGGDAGVVVLEDHGRAYPGHDVELVGGELAIGHGEPLLDAALDVGEALVLGDGQVEWVAKVGGLRVAEEVGDLDGLARRGLAVRAAAEVLLGHLLGPWWAPRA